MDPLRTQPVSRAARAIVVALVACLWLGLGPGPHVERSAAAERAAAEPAAAAVPVAIRPGCRGPANSVAVADALLRNRYTLASHPSVTLPANPAWNEDPLHSLNWRSNFHSLRFVLALLGAWAETDDTRYRDRAVFILKDWLRDNPRSAPRDRMAWYDGTTAWRAVVYACAADVLPAYTWLTTALYRHGRTLADPDFYRWDGGNHALNQDIGLLEVACHVGREEWGSLAKRRVSRLVTRSVDAAGAINEQSVYYALYNYGRYLYARTRFAECGVPLGTAFDRVDLMPAFLAHATQPDGTYVPIGDTNPSRASAIVGTPAEFAATQGAAGPRPSSTSRVYGAGYAFVRTGWGERRAFADEVLMSVRFGPGRVFHGHEDGTAITLYGYGAPVLLDSAMYSIEPGPYRRYFVGRRAHNVVTVDGATSRPEEPTSVLWKRSSDRLFELSMTGRPYAGVTANRRVTFSRALGYAIIDDRLTASSRRTFRQLWHLRPGAWPVTSGSRTWTRSARANVLIVRITPAATRIVQGATSPIQGWVSFQVFEKQAAPVVESRRTGVRAQFLTLLVPYATSRPAVSVSDVAITPRGYALTVTIDGVSERVAAGGDASWIASR